MTLKALKLVPDKNSTSGERLVLAPITSKPEPHPHDVARAAYALWMAEVLLGATPMNPAVSYLYDTRKEAYDEAVAKMREVLGNG